MVSTHDALKRRRILVIITVILLVLGSSAIGWLAATWPSWRAAILG
ncbi:MAG: hypothetical protein ACO329_06565 [Steroidobacteraceae bacterium]